MIKSAVGLLTEIDALADEAKANAEDYEVLEQLTIEIVQKAHSLSRLVNNNRPSTGSALHDQLHKSAFNMQTVYFNF